MTSQGIPFYENRIGNLETEILETATGTTTCIKGKWGGKQLK